MKKLICIIFIFFLIPAVSSAANFSPDRMYGMFESTYQHQKDIVNLSRTSKTKTLYQTLRQPSVAESIVQKINELPDKEPYEILSGNNPTKKPVIIQFKKLSDFNEKYKNYDALGWKTKGRLHIFINNFHKEAPLEALAALVVGRAYNLDEEDSANEEIYCWAAEGFAWEYYIRKEPKLKDMDGDLIERENEINKMLSKGQYSLEYVRKLILLNKGYSLYKQTSNGYSDEELEKKFDRLKKLYNYNPEDNA